MAASAIVEPIQIDGCAVRLTDTILGYNEKDLSETLKEKDLSETLKTTASEIGVCNISYIRFAQDKSTDTSQLTAIVTYSAEWQLRYFTRQYVNIDPVITRARRAVGPFDWDTLGDSDPAELAFLADAADHGVGRNGLSIPVRNRRGSFSLVSFTSDQSRAEWEQYKNDNAVRLRLLAVLIDSLGNISCKLPSPPVKLSRREEQCLIWAARGKTYQEIADILNLTFGSVKTHLDTARHKLHCMNLTHAAAYAVATGALPPKTLNPIRREEPGAQLVQSQREPSFDPSPAAERPEPAACASTPHPAPIASETMRTSTRPPATTR